MSQTQLTGEERSTAKRVVQMVAVLHKLSPSDVCGPRQDQGVMDARRDVAWVLRRSGFSSPKIGAVLNRDHTSILYLLKTTESPSAECLNF